MWGHYADSSTGFALAYDFKNRKYSGCDECNKQCNNRKTNIFLPVIYSDKRMDATEYAEWILKTRIMQDAITEKIVNFPREYLDIILPCPDTFMMNKVAIQKSGEWT